MGTVLLAWGSQELLLDLPNLLQLVGQPIQALTASYVDEVVSVHLASDLLLWVIEDARIALSLNEA